MELVQKKKKGLRKVCDVQLPFYANFCWESGVAGKEWKRMAGQEVSTSFDSCKLKKLILPGRTNQHALKMILLLKKNARDYRALIPPN